MEPFDVETAEEYDAALDASEDYLGELSARLVEPVPAEYLAIALLGLGTRARSLFRGFLNILGTDTPASTAFVLVRPAVEINLLVRFLVANPEVHLELWEADGDLWLLKWLEEVELDHELAALTSWPGIDELPVDLAALEAQIAKSRKLGLDAGVRGVSDSPRGRVMPDWREIAHRYGDLAGRHAYWAAYRTLSLYTHASSRGFTFSEFRETTDGRITFDELPNAAAHIRGHRAINAATFASTLTVISEPLGLDILEGAARTRDLLVRLRPPSSDA